MTNVFWGGFLVKLRKEGKKSGKNCQVFKTKKIEKKQKKPIPKSIKHNPSFF